MNRFNIVSIEDFKKGEKLDIYKINLIISFDDGYDDWIKNIVPVLRKYKIPALFFVSGGPVNEEGSQGEKPPSFSNIQGLTESDVVQLASVEHFVLGGHGLHHKDQSNLRENEFEHEVLENKKILETLTGYEVQYFAFPFGHRENFSEEIFRYYRYVFSMIPGFNRSIFPGKIIHRDSIDIYFSNLLFKSWLYGSYDWYWKIKNHGVLAGEKSA
jgi:peptidoglycan/xylan/chitin deacetylase (PgdA/CDA1 family)